MPLKAARSPCSDAGVNFVTCWDSSIGKVCKGGVGRARASAHLWSLTQRWVLEPITTSEQKRCMAITGQTGQPGSLAERPDVDNTNNCRCSLKSWSLINAQIQTGCCALECCRQAFPKALGCPHQALTACDHWRNQTQMLQDLPGHTEMCKTEGERNEGSWATVLDVVSYILHWIQPQVSGAAAALCIFLRVSALKLLRVGTFIIYWTAGLFIIEKNQGLLVIH